ncbi:MAG: MarR family winged helix-turn-helix transcriptional regulator [Mycobacteriales bacterium]
MAGRAGVEVEAAEDLEPIQEFVELIVAAARSPRQRDRLARAAGVPVTGAGIAVLGLVHRHGPVTVSDLGRRLQVDQSTASRQVRPLEELGLLSRTGHPTDGRSARLALTASGHRALTKVRAAWRHDFAVALASWPPEDRRQLAALLERLRLDLLEVRTGASGWAIEQLDGSTS